MFSESKYELDLGAGLMCFVASPILTWCWPVAACPPSAMLPGRRRCNQSDCHPRTTATSGSINAQVIDTFMVIIYSFPCKIDVLFMKSVGFKVKLHSYLPE